MEITLQHFLMTLGDAVVISDVSGNITLWNAAAERLFGFTQAQALGASLDIIIPEKYRQRHWTGYGNTMHNRMTKYHASLLRVPAVKQDGSLISIAFTVALLPGIKKEDSLIVAIIRDDRANFNEHKKG